MNPFFAELKARLPFRGRRKGPLTQPKRFQASQGVVRDRVTGLVWLQELSLNPWPRFWGEALEFIAELNARLHLGFGDWRLPNRRELMSLMDYTQAKPALPAGHPFLGLELAWYWSSTSFAGDPAYAWYVHTEGGRLFYGDKGRSYLLWPVRGSSEVLAATGQVRCYGANGAALPCAGSGQDGALRLGRPWPQPRFQAQGQTVSDRLSGLVWARAADLGPGPVSWFEASEVIGRLNELRLGGLSNWRLPNIEDLELLVDASAHHPALPAGHPFVGVAGQYWSATTSGFDPEWAMALYLDKGGVGVGMKKDAHYCVWAVSGD